MNHSLGLIIETLVAILLVMTIGYCMMLNRRLKRLKADEHSLKAVIGELITATEIAERAIGGLKLTVRDVNENLGSQLASATQLSEHLKRQLAEGDHVVRRLTKIAIAARPSQAETDIKEPAPREPVAREITSLEAAANPTNAKALAAAAQAFSERRRSGGLAA
jgi:chromosome segregation ATPase